MKPQYKELMQDILSQHRHGLSTDDASKCLAIIADCEKKDIPVEDVPGRYKEWALW